MRDRGWVVGCLVLFVLIVLGAVFQIVMTQMQNVTTDPTIAAMYDRVNQRDANGALGLFCEANPDDTAEIRQAVDAVQTAGRPLIYTLTKSESLHIAGTTFTDATFDATVVFPSGTSRTGFITVRDDIVSHCIMSMNLDAPAALTPTRPK